MLSNKSNSLPVVVKCMTMSRKTKNYAIFTFRELFGVFYVWFWGFVGFFSGFFIFISLFCFIFDFVFVFGLVCVFPP